MSLFAALSSAVSSLSTINRGTRVLSDNIANANNKDYVKRETELTTIGGAGGGGVTIHQIRRMTNEFLQRDLWTSRAQTAAEKIRSEYYSQIEQISGAAAGKTLLADAISRFTKAFKEMEAAPEVDGTRVTLLSAARDVEYEMTRISSALVSMKANVHQQIGDVIKDVNNKLSDIAYFNSRIAGAPLSQDHISNYENIIEGHINAISDYFELRVFRQGDGSYSIFTPGGVPLVDVAASEFGYNAERESLTNAKTGFDYTRDLPQGKLKAMIDFVASRDRTTHTGGSESVVENTDFRLGVIAKYESQLDAIARLLTRDNSGSGQGLANGRLRSAGPPPEWGEGVPSSKRGTFTESFGKIVYPDQIYINDGSANPAGGRNGFFVSRTFLRSLTDAFRDIVSTLPAAQEDADISRLTTEQRNFFSQYQGTATTATNALVYTLNQRAVAGGAPAPPADTTSRVNARQILDFLEGRLNGEAIPDESQHIKTPEAFTWMDNSVAPPVERRETPPVRPLAGQENHASVADLRGVVEAIRDYVAGNTPLIAGPPPVTTLRGYYTHATTSDTERFMFREALRDIRPDLFGTTFTWNAANARSEPAAGSALDPNLGLTHDELTRLANRIDNGQLEMINAPSLNDATSGSLEYYWSDKLFTPDAPATRDHSDINRFTFSVNENAEALLRSIQTDASRLGEVVANLTNPARELKAGGVEVENFNYSGVVRYVSVEHTRRSQDVSDNSKRLGDINDRLQTNYHNQTGVDIDQEITRMLTLQNSYAASAKVLSTISRMFDSLEAAMR